MEFYSTRPKQVKLYHDFLLNPEPSHHLIICLAHGFFWAPPRKLPSYFRLGDSRCEGTPNSEFLDLMNAIHHHVWLWCQEIWLCVVCIFSSFAFHPVLSWGKEKVKWLSWDRSFRVLSIWKHVTTYSLL